jgi:hypothetical protein
MGKQNGNLFSTLREVKILNGGFPIYKDVGLSIQVLDPRNLWPTSKYVLSPKLIFLSRLQAEFLTCGWDMFRMVDIQEYNAVRIAPPIIERDGEKSLIVDGIHRIYLARAVGFFINCVVVEGIPQEYPIIGLPVPWDEVKVYEEAPRDPKARRNLRPGINDTTECLTAYFRDLSGLGSNGRRPTLGQKG